MRRGATPISGEMHDKERTGKVQNFSWIRKFRPSALAASEQSRSHPPAWCLQERYRQDHRRVATSPVSFHRRKKPRAESVTCNFTPIALALYPERRSGWAYFADDPGRCKADSAPKMDSDGLQVPIGASTPDVDGGRQGIADEKTASAASGSENDNTSSGTRVCGGRPADVAGVDWRGAGPRGCCTRYVTVRF